MTNTNTNTKTTASINTVNNTDRTDTVPMMTYTPFYDGGRYKDDILVILNGHEYRLRRGVPAEIPEPVYDIVIASEARGGQ